MKIPHFAGRKFTGWQLTKGAASTESPGKLSPTRVGATFGAAAPKSGRAKKGLNEGEAPASKDVSFGYHVGRNMGHVRMRTVSQAKKKWKVWKIGLAAIAGYAFLICLAIPELVGNRCLPRWLQGEAHTDYYLSWTRWIPRSATSWCIDEAPVQLLGNQKEKAVARNGAAGPKPIPGPGEWQVSAVQLKNGWPLFLPYLAFTTKSGTHLRIGCRWDDVDRYYTFPSFALAKLTPSAS